MKPLKGDGMCHKGLIWRFFALSNIACPHHSCMYVQSTHSIVTSIKKHLEMKQDVGIAEQEKYVRRLN